MSYVPPPGFDTPPVPRTAAIERSAPVFSPTLEPVRLAAAAQSLIAAVIGLLTVFDVWHPSQDQVTAMMLVYTALLPVIGAIVRSKVTPVAKLNGRQ